VTFQTGTDKRAHTLKVGEQLKHGTIGRSAAAATAITVTLNSTFIRGREESERHLEVRVGNVENGRWRPPGVRRRRRKRYRPQRPDSAKP
jgi:hypothetical protein